MFAGISRRFVLLDGAFGSSTFKARQTRWRRAERGEVFSRL